MHALMAVIGNVKRYICADKHMMSLSATQNVALYTSTTVAFQKACL